MFCTLLSTAVVLIAYVLYKLSANNAKYFEDQNLKYRGISSILENFMAIAFGKVDVFTMLKNMYDAIDAP